MELNEYEYHIDSDSDTHHDDIINDTCKYMINYDNNIKIYYDLRYRYPYLFDNISFINFIDFINNENYKPLEQIYNINFIIKEYNDDINNLTIILNKEYYDIIYFISNFI